MKPSTRAIDIAGISIGLVFCAAIIAHPTVRHAWTAALHAAALRENNCATAPTGATAPADRKQILEGTDEDDIITGTPGDDWMFGYKGTDVLNGGAGNDKIDGGLGDDLIDGGVGADLLFGCEGNDTIHGGDGDDVIDAGDGDDFVDAGAGNDRIDGGDGNDVFRGGPGNDVISGGDENDFLEGGTGNDRLSGDDANDVLRGGVGDDILFGGDGDDNLDGESGDDRLDGGRGNDVLRGGAGNDTLLGNAGTDTLDGGDGHDILFGGDGNDVISGGFGDDLIAGGAAADALSGNEGNDLFLLRAGDVPAGAVESIDGGVGRDALILAGFSKVPAPPAAGSAAEWQIVDPMTGGIYRIVNVERVEFSQVLAQVQEDAEHALSILLVNASGTATTGRVLFFGAEGSIVPALTAGAASAREDVTFTVPAYGSTRLGVQVRGDVTAQIFAAAPVGALVRSEPPSAAAPPLVGTPMIDSAIIPVREDRAGGIGTGVLVVNSFAQSRVKFGLHTLDGTERDGGPFIGAKEIDIPAYGHSTMYVRDMFPAVPPDFQGTLTIQGGFDRPQEGGPIAVLGLTRGSNGRVSSVPAIPMAPAVGTETPHIAGLSAGGDTATTSVVVINPSPTGNAQGTLRFFSESGAAWPVAVNRQPAAATVNYDLESQASAVFTLPNGGALQHGSVRAESSKGVVTLLLRVAGRDGAVGQMPASRILSSFITAARRDRASGATTQLSLSSTGAATVVQVKLRTAAGADVANGTAEIRLPANGQTMRTLEQLFPAAAADTFDGTLAVTATGGAIAATAILLDGTVATVLPIAALQ